MDNGKIIEKLLDYGHMFKKMAWLIEACHSLYMVDKT